MTTPLPPFDAVLLLSFGGPEGPDDVMPFLENVTRGRRVPRERLEVVARQYLAFGGRSPINDECRRLVAALEDEFARRGPRLPVYWGNRNWAPLLSDTMATMARDGVRRAVAVTTSAYSSYSACRQYLEDVERARAAVGPAAPLVEKLPPYWNNAGFIETMIANARTAIAALAALGGGTEADRASVSTGGGDVAAPLARLVFTAHSLPMSMSSGCDYVAQLREASSLVAAGAAPDLEWDLVYQSRSGPPSQPWLEPDVGDHLRALHAAGTRRVVLVPIGFTADHMEVLYDLDTLARGVADSLGMTMTRAACVGAAPLFVAGLRDLVAAHVEGRRAPVLGALGPRPSPCAPACCPA
ncbi:MAG: ferrochelatase [Candidatus Binatia bacterium]